jgi:hypothetical protein
MSFEGLLNQDGVVFRPEQQLSPDGSSVLVYPADGAAVRVAIQGAAGGQVQRDYGRVADERWRVFLPATADVRVNDRLVEGGRTFTVLRVENLRGHHQEAELRLEALG